MPISELFYRGALTLAISLIVGLQRERSGKSLAGIRTFPLIALSGFFCALLAQIFGGWIIAGGVLSLALIIFANTKSTEKENGPGITTESAAVLLFLIGSYLAAGEKIGLAVVGGGIAALLLYFKEPIHGVIEQMKQGEIRAIMNFVLIAFVILPLLPDTAYDPYDVLNPREIWMMVVLIAGISLVSYALQKVYSNKSGALWLGILGGLISSTAATVTYARRSRQMSGSDFLVLAVVVASTAALVRIFVEVMIVIPAFAHQIAPPLIAMFAWMCAICGFAYWQLRKSTGEGSPSTDDPFQLRVAIIFGLLYAVILYATAWAGNRFGTEGLYVLSVVSGLIDVDAITISTAQLIDKRAIEVETGWRVILLAALSNLVFKAAIASFLSQGVARVKMPAYLLAGLVGGGAILALWP